MKDLKITLLQSTLFWEQPEANRNHFGKKLKDVRKNSTHLILLPELFTSGFTMNAKSVAESMEGPSVAWMLEMAENKNAVVCGSLVIKEKNKFFNRLIWAQPDGKIVHYDKRHLFRMAKEDKTYEQGKDRLLIDLNGWNICPLVCYDLRFPVWSRSKGEIDLLVYIANWPSRRSYPWKQLLIARAIENQCFVAGLNRIGMDGNNILHSGDSVALDPLGMSISTIKANKESVETCTLKYKQLEELRASFPVLKDADKFKII
ncbi:MAG: amidohydrolase [Bacteroidetes bacterium]|nr:amidohydrolase [Bacteroidota bacterium]